MVGLPKSIIKKYGISKKAWEVFRGKKSKGSNPRPKKARKVKRKVAKRKRSRRRGGMTIPLAPIIGLGIGIFTKRPAWGKSAFEHAIAGEFDWAMESLKQSYLGIRPDGKFDITLMSHGLLPLAIGLGVHKFIGGSPLNANRILAAARVPFIRI